MKSDKLFIIAMALLLLSGIFTPLAAGENDSLHVVVTVEDRNYGVGDYIEILLNTYDNGAPADVGSASLVVSTHYNLNVNPVNISVTNQGTGVYKGSYLVTEGDYNRNLYFSYSVTSGNDQEEGRFSVRTYAVRDTVDVTVGGQKEVPAKPGTTLTATVLVRTGDNPRQISGFSNLYLEAPDGTRDNLTHTIRDTGIYDVTVPVPSTPVSGAYELVAQPIGLGEDSATIQVNVMDVWYHRVLVTQTTVSFEVCVADNEGAPINGASIFIKRVNTNNFYTGTTNASGRAMFSVTDISGDVGFVGHVIASGLNQSITGSIHNPVAEQPHHNDFDIVWEGTETVFEPDKQVSIPYGAYDARVHASGKTIIYYVTATGTDFTMFGDEGNHVDAPREVIATGSVATDSLGKFSIAFKTPATQCAIAIRLEVPLDRMDFPNQDYDGDDDMYYDAWPQNAWDTSGFRFYAYEGKLDGDKGVSVKLGRFNPGKPGSVSVEFDAGLGDPIHAMWGIGEATLEDAESHNPEWARWVPAGNVVTLQVDEKGKYQGEFLVPEFIGKQDVTVAAGYVDPVGIPHFDSSTKSPGGGSIWPWVALATIIILAVIVAAYFIKQKYY